MKRMGTPLALAAVAVVLGGYIWFYESKSQTSEDAARDARKLSKGFERDKVTSIEIARLGGETVVLEKKGQGQDFRLVRPVAFAADRALVDELLSGLEFLEQQRVLEGKGVRAQYGLERPRVRVRTRGGGRELDFSVGTQSDPTGKSVYVAAGNEPRVFVVDKRFAEQVDKGADDLRDKRALALDRAQVATLRVGDVTLKREGPVWRLAGGVRADPTRVGDLEKAIEDLRVTRWVQKRPDSGTAAQILAADAATVRIGGPCPGHDGERVAERTGRDDATFCLKSADTEKLVADPAQLRDSKLVLARSDEVKAVTIEAGGAKVALAREDGSWKLKQPAGQAADDEAVRKWIEDLSAYRALEFAAFDPAKLGLLHAALVTLETEAGGKEVVRIGDAQGGRRWARRGDEPVALAVHAEVGGQVRADPLLFRSRRLLTFVRFDVKRLEGRQAGLEEVAQKGDSETWKLVKPVALEADADVMDKLLSALADLRAERFLLTVPTGALQAPRQLTVQVEPPPGAKTDGGIAKAETHKVEVGADTEGGCVARADGGPAFVVAKDKCADLRAHLATRKLLTLAEDKLSGFELARANRRERAEKRGPNWYVGSARVEQSRIDGLVSALRGLAAKDALTYGPDKAHGLEHPRLVLRIQAEGSPEVTVAIGSADAKGDAWARVSGRDVTYLLAKDQVESLEKTVLASDRTN